MPKRLLVRWIFQSTMELFVLVEMEFWLRLVSLSLLLANVDDRVCFYTFHVYIAKYFVVLKNN